LLRTQEALVAPHSEGVGLEGYAFMVVKFGQGDEMKKKAKKAKKKNFMNSLWNRLAWQPATSVQCIHRSTLSLFSKRRGLCNLSPEDQVIVRSHVYLEFEFEFLIIVERYTQGNPNSRRQQLMHLRSLCKSMIQPCLK
jgi:hypothetical protein